MERTKQSASESKPAGGVAGDVRRLKSDGTATVAELRQFLGQMRGRSPQEVLGMVAESGLTKSTIVATFGFVVLLVVFTVVPYYLGDRPAAASGPVAAEGAANNPGTPAADAPQDGGQPATAEGASAAAEGDQPDGEKAVEALGIGETKTADPDKNPLENKLDNLLDKIE